MSTDLQCPPELQELLKTLYDLSPQEAEVFTYLCDRETRIREIAEAFGKDRSTIQRYVSTLRSADLVSRRSVTTDSGKGRYFVYYVRDKDELKQKIRDRLEQWEEEKLARLDEL